jgi:acylphosphatase
VKNNVRAHLTITGRVQGVCFRYEAYAAARLLGVKGWVLNKMDGSVEVLMEGDKDSVGKMILWCHKGPSGALVDNVIVKWEEYKGEFVDFRII